MASVNGCGTDESENSAPRRKFISSLASVPIEILVLAGSTWSGLACVLGALVVVAARTNWFLPSLLSALMCFGMPVLGAITLRWWLWEPGHPQRPVSSHRLQVRLGPEAWTSSKLPSYTAYPVFQMPRIDTESLHVDHLVRHVNLKVDIELHPNCHSSIPLGASRPPLILVTSKAGTSITVCASVKPCGSTDEAEVQELSLSASYPLDLLNIVPTLVNLHDLVEDNRWMLCKQHGPRLFPLLVLCCASVCQFLLKVLEMIAVVGLTDVYARPKGPQNKRYLALYFSGWVCLFGFLHVPFWYIRLPRFILPAPHTHLSALLSKEPFATARIRKHRSIPIAKVLAAVPELIRDFEISCEAVVDAPSIDIQACAEDATVIGTDIRMGSWTGQSQEIRTKAFVKGSLARDNVHVVLQKLSINGLLATGSLDVVSAAPPGTKGKALLEALAQAALAGTPYADSAEPSPKGALAKVSAKFEIVELSPLVDLYAHGKISHPLMRCGHEGWGAARTLTLGGWCDVKNAELHAGSPGSGLSLRLPNYPTVNMSFEAGELEIPAIDEGETPSWGLPNAEGTGDPTPLTTIITGHTTTQMGLTSGKLGVRLDGGAEGKYLLHVTYSSDVDIEVEYEVPQLWELGLESAEVLQTNSKVHLMGELRACLDAKQEALEILHGTGFTAQISDTACALGPRVLRFPNGSVLAVEIPELRVGYHWPETDPCVNVSWKCGVWSPTLEDMESDLPALDLLPWSMRNGALRLRISSVGRVSVEPVEESRSCGAFSMVTSPLTPATLVLSERRLQNKIASNYFTLDLLLDPLSPEGVDFWTALSECQEFEDKLLHLCAIISADVQKYAKKAVGIFKRARTVIREEGIEEPKDIIPADKLTIVFAKLLSDTNPAGVYQQLYPLVMSTIAGNGIDVNKMKEILVKHLPILEDYPFEMDRTLRIINIFMSPTPPIPPIARQYLYPLAERQEHQPILRNVPPAAEIYAVVDDHSEPLQQEWSHKLADVAPLLTVQQLEYILVISNRSDWPPEAFARLKYVKDLKRAVGKISDDWGDIGHLAQTHVVATLLSKAIHASLGWPGKYMKALPVQAEFLTCMMAAAGDGTAKVPSEGPNHTALAEKYSHNSLAGQSPKASIPKLNLAAKKRGRRSRSSSDETSSTQTEVIGASLLGPSDVAALLRSGLAGLQSYVAQANFRMLIELALAQPPFFLRGVLYELSDNGSQRALAQILLRLVNVEQSAFLEPIDIAALFEKHLGVAIPHRKEYMAGGRWSRQSYYQAMITAANMILDEAEPYLAVQSHLQVALPFEAEDAMLGSSRGAGTSGLPQSVSGDGLSPGIEALTRRAIAAIQEADERAQAALAEVSSSPLRSTLSALRWNAAPVHDNTAELSGAVTAYRDAFSACRAVLQQDSKVTLGRDWFRSFWQRNHEALMMECVLRAVQEDVEHARLWLAAQPDSDEKSLRQHNYGTGSWENEQWLLDLLIDVTYYLQSERDSIRRDPLVRLLICNDPDERYEFTVVSVMGVVSQGAEGLELEQIYKRYAARRGVKFIRADCGTAKSHEFNATKVEEAIRKVDTATWGFIGYSQGCANIWKAESRLCSGTPEQRMLTAGLRCRNLIAPAANGTAQMTCGEWKITKGVVEVEHSMKHHQVYFSSEVQDAFFDIFFTVAMGRGLFSFLGGMHSLSHAGVQQLWREAHHKDGVPTSCIRGVVEAHNQPETLDLVARWYTRQLESSLHDTQVSLDEAVGHPIYVHNTNSLMLARLDLGGAVQRMSHWAPLKEDTAMVTTASDVERRCYDFPKDRFVYPWLELNARFGFVPKASKTYDPHRQVNQNVDANVRRRGNAAPGTTSPQLTPQKMPRYGEVRNLRARKPNSSRSPDA